jgi:hypothetical protein
MVRFAASRLLRGKWESDKDQSACLEFLVHYRNLIEFLGKEQHLVQDTDLHVSNIWNRLGMPKPAQLPEIRQQGNNLWAKYERVEDRISRYLQHCTTLRTESKSWEVGTMNGELEPILADGFGNSIRQQTNCLPRWCGREDFGSDGLCCKLPRLTYWRGSESRHFDPAGADESIVSDVRDIHRLALGRRSSGFCDGKAASTKKSLTVSLTVRGNRNA